MTTLWGAAVVAVGLTIAMRAEAATVVTPEAKPTPAQETAVKKVLAPGDRNEPFTVGTADLNGDGKPDLIAQFTSMMECGTAGCSAVAVLATANGYAGKAIVLANFHERVTVLDTMHHGMHDLKFDDASYIFKWNGKAYQ
jgi:hypothetical protein